MGRSVAASSRTFVGTSGFMCRHWGRGVFYAPGLAQRKWLDHYVRHFDTVEIKGEMAGSVSVTEPADV